MQFKRKVSENRESQTGVNAAANEVQQIDVGDQFAEFEERVTNREQSSRTVADDEQTAKLAAIVDALGRPQAMIEFEVDGTIVSANENFLTTMGYSLAEIEGQHQADKEQKSDPEPNGHVGKRLR